MVDAMLAFFQKPIFTSPALMQTFALLASTETAQLANALIQKVTIRFIALETDCRVRTIQAPF